MSDDFNRAFYEVRNVDINTIASCICSLPLSPLPFPLYPASLGMLSLQDANIIDSIAKSL
jgi:hypothetical protein